MQLRDRQTWPWWLRPLWNALPDPEGSGGFTDGAAWATRMILGLIHLAFALAALLRPNLPLLYPSFSAFDDVVPFVWWGYAGVGAALMLLLIRSISPWGIVPSTLSMVLFYLMAASFSFGAGITTGTLVYNALGIVSTVLMIRSLSVIEARLKAWRRVRSAERGRG